MNLQVKVDFSDVERQLRKLSADSGLAVQDIANDQMRLYCQDMLRFTPPKKSTEGKRAVQRDLNKIFSGMSAPFREFVEDVDRSTRWPTAAPIEGDLHSWHQSHRGARGRVTHKPHEAARFGKVIIENKMYVRKAELRKYARSVWAHVGRLKAGWIKSLEYYSGLARNVARIPSWVSKVAMREGSFGGRISNAGRGDVWAENSVPYAGAAISESYIALAHRKRVNDITKHLEKRMDKLVEQFNGGVEVAA